jgi:hypothetical protein
MRDIVGRHGWTIEDELEDLRSELEAVKREAVEVDELLASLWRYGQLHTVEGVIYPNGSHKQVLEAVDKHLHRRDG